MAHCPRWIHSAVCASMFAVLSLGLATSAFAQRVNPTENFLKNLPPGLYLQSSLEVPANQLPAIGGKLGGTITRLTNSHLTVHGVPVQVNGIHTPNDAAAEAILKSLLKIKPKPYCLRKGQLVVEYVGRNLQPATVIKTTFELGFRSKPERIRYRVAAELATISKADYMSCNPLFNQFLLAERSNSKDAAATKIDKLAEKFEFGRRLSLRSPELATPPITYKFLPQPTSRVSVGPVLQLNFPQPPLRNGVPFVRTSIEVEVDSSGVRPVTKEPDASATAATKFWPADDPDIIALARRITSGKRSNGAKAMAILRWLRPGEQIKYAGATGSRWGTQKVFQQKFGHCWDFSDCFVTLCRAVDIPSRQVAGWFYGSSGHVWAEFYREGVGWQQVDPTGGGDLRCGVYHIPYFTTNDGEMPIVYLSMPKIEMLAPRLAE